MENQNSKFEKYEQFSHSNILTIEKTFYNYFILLKNGTLISVLDKNIETLGRRIRQNSEIDQTIGKVEINEKVIDVRCGERHVLALTICGKIYSWGNNEFGQVKITYILNLYFSLKLGHKSINDFEDEKLFKLPNRIKYFEVRC